MAVVNAPYLFEGRAKIIGLRDKLFAGLLAALSIVYRGPQENPLMMAQLRAQKRAVIKGPLNFFSEGEFSFKRNG